MIDFLRKYNVSDKTIKELIETKSDSYLFDLNCNEEECCKIVDYLKNIGIEVIDELLLNNTELFLKNIKKVELAFSKYDIKELVQLINDDSNEIENILKFL